MKKIITPDIVVAYTQCKRKAFLLLCSGEKSHPHEYVFILEGQIKKNREEYMNALRLKGREIWPYSFQNIKQGKEILFDAILEHEDLKSYCDVLTRRNGSAKRKHIYEPTLVVGSHKISKEQKLQVAFIGYILSMLQNHTSGPVSGTIIGSENNTQKIKLAGHFKEIPSIIEDLREWANSPEPEVPLVILNKNCIYCPFNKNCTSKAEENDDLSLLSRMPPKLIEKYRRKGIFTINQLSYLFRPRKKRRRKTKNTVRYRPEVQALAIRTKKIYIQELPKVPRCKIELFLDIEGVPDKDFYYLIGLLIFDGKNQLQYSFWADSKDDEKRIWNSFIEKISEYPDAPIYHYGKYERKAIRNFMERYGEKSDVERRIVNVNTFIYGKIYFPVVSNNLKVLGKFVGASWTHPDSSGLQSLVWRYCWERDSNEQCKKLLITYNTEDCNALWLLTEKLSRIIETANSKWDIDFIDKPKKHSTEIGIQIHEELEKMLKYAHADYNKNKISIKSKEPDKSDEPKKKIFQSYGRIVPKAGKVIWVIPRRKCPDCRRPLKPTERTGEITITDLVFTKNGFRKTIIKYVGKKGYCGTCGHYYSPKMIKNFECQKFGHSFMAWTIYQRIVLRLSYRIIVRTMEDMFNERVATGTIIRFMRHFAMYYSYSEKITLQNMLKSLFIHVDETKINIQGVDHYVWVFTDGKHVIFKKTETREPAIVYEILSNYKGVVVSDFYPGYDSLKCQQQKCLSHLIRDINDELWKDPFNTEFEQFVLEVKNLLEPILQSVQKYGLKKWHLNKFNSQVERFYKRNIEHQSCKSEVTMRFQKRFHKYRESLFTFLKDDGIPWNNNMAERAIRHLAIQRKISGTFFDSLIVEYLSLLGIAQTCRFQNKPFLKFLLSKEKDIGLFKTPKPKKYSIPFGKIKNQTD